MIALIFALLLFYLLWCRPYSRNLFSTGEYMGLQRTTMLNGIMIMLVFVSHASGYLPKNAELWAVDRYCLLCKNLIGQLMVAGFFFYSGFGIMESIVRKGKGYLDCFPRQRFFKVLFRFDIAILCFWLLAFLLGRSYDWETIALAFTGWTAIGNSNWFIFVTLVLYLICYVSFRWCGKWRWFALWGGCLLLMMILIKNKGVWWYDSFLCFPAGMSFSVLRGWIEKQLTGLKVPVSLVGIALVFSAIVFYNFIAPRFGLFYFAPANLAAMMMAYGTVLMVSGIDFRKSPKGLIWMGGALFSLYIYQRVPMSVLKEATDMEENFALYLPVCLMLTLPIVFISERFYKWLDKFCFHVKK